MKFAPLVFLLITLLSCEKVDFSDDNSYLLGDYEWVYTKNSNVDYLTSAESDDKYGLRINKKSKILFFKNGNEENEKTISRMGEDNGTSVLYIKESRKSWSIMHFSGDTLISFLFPHSGRSNYFIKK